MHSSLILDGNKKVINLISIRISSVKINPFDTILEPTITNLASGRVILKFNNSGLVQKSYIVCELINCPHNPTNNFPLEIVYLVQSNQLESQSKVNLLIIVEEQYLMEKVYGVLTMTFQEML